MNKKTRTLTLTALFIALGVTFPQAFHSIANAGSIFCPMHVPVLLCGLVLGPSSGLICGIITPILSNLFFSMPPAGPVLYRMIVELAVYGFTGGLLMSKVNIKNDVVKVYGCLLGAMLTGRIIAGLFTWFVINGGVYTLSTWVTAYFVTGILGIIMHLILVPICWFALKKAKLIK